MAANANPVASTCCTFLSWFRTEEQLPPCVGWPQVTTDPFAKMAANAAPGGAHLVAWTCWMFLSWFLTLELSPPQSPLPHVTIRSPPQHQAAKAWRVAAIFARCTSAVRCSPSWIPAACNESMGWVRARFVDVTSLKNFCPKDCWARTCRSPTVECSGRSSVSLRPLGNETLTRNILSILNHKHWAKCIDILSLYNVSSIVNPSMWFDATQIWE